MPSIFAPLRMMSPTSLTSSSPAVAVAPADSSPISSAARAKRLIRLKPGLGIFGSGRPLIAEPER